VRVPFPPLDRLVPDHVRGFEAYIPSRPDDVLCRLYRCERLHRLNNNENPLGPPEAARKVLDDWPPSDASIYPSGDAYHLRCRLGERLGLDPDCFIVGNGANEVIAFVIKAFCQEGDNIVTVDRTFAVYEWVAQFSGFEARVLPLKDDRFDGEAMLAAMDERTKVLFLCNPNNPTGTYWSEDELRSFLDRVNGRCIVVVDEAYMEFVEASDFPRTVSMLDDYPNLVVFRTFSKMYGLAGLRIGYLFGDRRVVDDIRRTCVVYSVNGPAQVAAIAALSDDGPHIEATRKMCREAREYLLEELADMGLPHTAREGNFAVASLPMSDTLAYRKLMRRGIMIRSMTGFRAPNQIRVTLSTLPVMEEFVKALRGIIT